MPLSEGIQLQPHQAALRAEADAARASGEPLRKMLLWSVGSGKSIGALSAADALGGVTSVVAPAAVRPSLQNEAGRTLGRSDIPVLSYNQAARGTEAPDTLLVDEAHRLGSPGSAQAKAVANLAEQSKNVLLMTGTPVRNSPKELAPLLSILSGRSIDQKAFADKFIGAESRRPGGLLGWLRGTPIVTQPSLVNTDELKSLLRGHVDFYENDKPPVGVTNETHEVEMSPRQADLYRGFWDDLPFTLRWKLKNRYDLTPAELRRFQSFMTGPRQVGLSDYNFRPDGNPLKAFDASSKLRKAYELLQAKLDADPRAKAMVFSSFPSSGLVPYAAKLQAAGVPHAMFDGSLNDAERKDLVNRFNDGRIRVALLGPAAAEGISLRGAQLAQLLDPAWHESRLRQAAARVIRYDSHHGLPPELQHVMVQRFVSKLPLGFKDRLLASLGVNRDPQRQTVDDYLMQLSDRKERLNNQLMALLREVGSRDPVGDAVLTRKAAAFAGLIRDGKWSDPDVSDALSAVSDGVFATKAAQAAGLTKEGSSLGTLILKLLTSAAGSFAARATRYGMLDPADQQAVAYGVMGGLPVALGGQLAAGHVANRLMKAERRLNAGEEKKILAASGVHPETPIEVSEDENAYYQSHGPIDRLFRLDTPEALRHGRVVLGKNYESPAVLAHELGHADVAQNSNLLSRLNQSIGRTMSVVPTIAATAGVAPVAGAALGPVGGLAVGGLAGLVAGAPALFNEYQASSRAMKTLRRAGLPEPDLAGARKGLIGAFGTYAAGAALPAAAVGGGVGLAKMYLDSQKGAAAPPPATPMSPVTLLRQAKAHSDRGDYEAKTQIVRDLIRRRPADWVVDSRLPPRFVGLTHVGSGFKIHLPEQAVTDLLPVPPDAPIAGYPRLPA